MLLRLAIYGIQSYRAKKFIEIQKNGMWKKSSKPKEEVKSPSFAENSETKFSSTTTGDKEEHVPQEGKEEKQEESAEYNSEKNMYLNELKKCLENPERKEREKCFRDRFWDRGQNKANVSELMRRKKAFDQIELVNLDILQWFCDKWLGDIDESGVDKDTKLEFYLWLEANYMEHLIAHQKHKKGHFVSALSRIRKEARLQGVQKVLSCLGKMGATFVGIFSIANLNEVIVCLKGFIQAETISLEVKIFGGIIIVVFFASFLWSVFSLFMKTEYGRRKSEVTNNKETWLRHHEVIVGYQNEMLDYIWGIGCYTACLLDENRDRRLMSNMKDVWNKNAKKFQENMNKQKLTDR